MSSGKKRQSRSEKTFDFSPKKPNLGPHAARLGLANLRQIPFSDSPNDRTSRAFERNGVGLFTDGHNKWVVPLADDDGSTTSSSISSGTSRSSQRSVSVVDVVTISDDETDTKVHSASESPCFTEKAHSASESPCFTKKAHSASENLCFTEKAHSARENLCFTEKAHSASEIPCFTKEAHSASENLCFTEKAHSAKQKGNSSEKSYSTTEESYSAAEEAYPTKEKRFIAGNEPSSSVQDERHQNWKKDKAAENSVAKAK
ncbi:hypothetical protein QR680_005184 [Steinernema hermaphroditum]|uniref:Uncharacterized protein n=1 Tax=Steinernema hermaphroditum TaxID=289476 RepID=A0AA39LV79_9BILA|nr:hypothetical protein QR680_005184 [Steinernema hermaphroditum]